MLNSAPMDRSLIARYDGRVPRYTSYPTAPHFHEGVDAGAYAGWLAALPEEAPLSLYLHVPFCDTLCWFCGCHTTVVNRPEPVSAYLEVLQAEIDLVGRTIGGWRRVVHLHLGGGSPTMLRPDEVERLFAALGRRFDLDPAGEIAVEIDPRGLARETVEALGRAGLNRASIGVQALDPKVQAAVNRIQPFKATARAVEWLRAAGVRGVNMDLMYGLPHQTTAGTAETMRRILDLAPDRVALFGYAHVPWMKRHQRLIDEAALPGAESRWRQFEAAAAELDAAGYVRIGLDHFARPDDGLARAWRAGRLRRNFQGYTENQADALIGLGASAIGELPQGYVQNVVRTPDYAEAVRTGRLATARGVMLGDEDRLRRAVIERLMCDMTVDLEAVCARHGFAPETLSGELESLDPMRTDGVVAVDGWHVTVAEAARPLLRTVCAAFDAYLAPDETRHARAV